MKDFFPAKGEQFPMDAVLRMWFKGQGGYDARNPVWRELKGQLKTRGHWKNLPRGDPAKGYQRMQERREAP